MPALFVLLWSTGFIGAKFGLPYAEPATFLTLRFAIVASLLAILALVTRAPWPRSWTEAGHIAVAGLLVHGTYLGGVFGSIYHGVDAGVSSLIVGIQPLLVAAVARPVLGERVPRLTWLGLVLGFVGVILVVWNKLGIGSGTQLGYALSVLALFGITAGTVYQKKYCAHTDLRSANAIQFAASAVVLLPFALALETMRIEWTWRFIFALAWLCLLLSVGAITLLYLLIRHDAAARVASLLYMVPPCTALLAWLLFDETLSAVALTGMACAAAGVALVSVSR